jgi:hypothetical protein
VDINLQSKASIRIVRPELENLVHVGRDSRDAEPARFIIESVIELLQTQALVAEKVHRRPGSIVPLRVPVTTPSTGVNPIDVSTQIPLQRAEPKAPFRKWAITRRPSFRANISAER